MRAFFLCILAASAIVLTAPTAFAQHRGEFHPGVGGHYVGGVPHQYADPCLTWNGAVWVNSCATTVVPGVVYRGGFNRGVGIRRGIHR